jgi:phytoene desaturase
MTPKKRVLVVGAGPGGLATAMILAHRGFEVEVFEKEEIVGGRNAEIKLGPYTFDLGPTFLMMKFLMDELFEEAGRKTADYLDCRRLDPMYRLQFGDRSLLVTSDRESMKSQIEAVFPGESKKLDLFYERESKRFAAMYPCLQKTYGGLHDFLSVTLLKAFPQLAPGRSLYDVLSDYFESEELRLAFTFQSKYLGMSPWECPGLFAMIPYTEHAHGIYHVMGGLSEISKAFGRVAGENGAKIHLGRPIAEVLVENGKARGVKLPSGERVLADDVVVNADFGHAVEKLFPHEALKKWKPERLEKAKYSCSTFMMYLGLDRSYDVEHHAIFFAKDYKKNLEDISNRLCLSEDFSVYVRNASPMDPVLAPAGHSALYVLAPMPNNRSGIDWKVEGPRFREKLLDFLEKKTPFKDLRKHIREELTVSPGDWEEKFSVYKGATFNMGHQLSQLLYLRPHNEFEDFGNCYLVGGGTHPGSGLPTIFESARIASNLLSKKYGLEYPQPPPFVEGRHLA